MDETFNLLTGDHFHVILHPNREHGLIFNRIDKAVTTINYDDARELSNVKLVGRTYGIVGRFLENYLVLIKSRSKVGSLYEPNSKTNHDIYVITQVQVISLAVNNSEKPQSSGGNDSVRYNVTPARDHDTVGEYQMADMKTSESFSSLPVTINSNGYLSAQRATNWNPFKLASSLKPMVPSQLLKPFNPVDSQSQETPAKQSDSESGQANQDIPAEGADRRLVEEMVKLFNNTNSFYYSPTLDLTNRFSRKNLIRKVGNEAVWRAADERFFWNRYMLKDLIELSKENIDANHFICVILQGFIAIQQYSGGTCKFTRDIDNMVNDMSGNQATSMSFITTQLDNSKDDCDDHIKNQDRNDKNFSSSSERAKFSPKTYQLALVSRRSVFQAGTRYRRRGCDENGHCANFVETEQIFKSGEHFISLVMIRGSIPLFWYQTGYNYRPPPVLSRSEEENHLAFSKHFMGLIHQYETEQVIAIDCTEQEGREKVLHDAFLKHMNRFREIHPKTRIIQFDYHKYCRRRQCSDLQIAQHMQACGLTEQTLKDIKYYWNDGDVVVKQEGVFRVNCLDCSDRTNVVQRIIALQILDLQLVRLGIIAPDTGPEENECKRIMQAMWSTNGNVLSTQYCGTRALFGGERKLAGYIKDTYSSASRYYISKFRDVYRQAAIDAMLGVENADAANLESGTFKDQYELLSFDPILAGRAGGAMLKDVGCRVTNRLARLKGRFNNVRPSGQMEASFLRRDPAGIIETGLTEPMGEMSIDWPSSESVNCPQGNQQPVVEAREAHDVFACYANCDDNFQDDDELGQLMLSIDVAELQRLREDEENARSAIEVEKEDVQQMLSQNDSKST